MTDLNKEREAFEYWADAKCYYLDKREDGHYEKGSTALAWEIAQYFMAVGRNQELEKAKAQAVPSWISVKDEEPPTDTMVLICWSDSPDVQPEIDYMTCDEDLNHIWANFYKDPPTHWMHFHKVPSESGAEQ
ncbi:Uncharacterised protein [Acinetobacter baumannii]|uniref:DUF551 domain-containing protein n=1 Tax=Acinetobacter baumannii TaxID=470 RepID=UPI0008199141|nr:DUF551 domain-containing protein [Acinetobacter baumannii]SCD14930.1 Uncharacterised protein [Acinetobacter baumannii]